METLTNCQILRSELVGYPLLLFPLYIEMYKGCHCLIFPAPAICKTKALTLVSSSVGFYLNRLQIVRLCFEHMTIYQLEAHECKVNCLREVVFKS